MKDLESPVRAADLLRLVLMFYAAGPVTPEMRLVWMQVAGSGDMTTKVMCDAIRAYLGGVAEKREDHERRLGEALLDALQQGCHEDGGWFDTMALSAYRDGWELAVEMGLAERRGELVGRRGFYRPVRGDDQRS
jgi:hypothetical protein